MALPNDNPTNPALPAPLFSDGDAGRADQMRALAQDVWQNEEYLNIGKNINDASSETPVDSDEVGFWKVAGETLKKITFANLFVWIGTKVAALAAKTTPVDADSLAIVDSDAANVQKRLTFANLWAWIMSKIVLGPAVNALIPVLHNHGIFNAKFTAVNNGTTEQSFSLEPSVSTFDLLCAVRKAGTTGDVSWLSSSSAIKIQLPTQTWNAAISGITVTGAYKFYKYAVSDNGNLRTMISRSPYHKSVPANYYHTTTNTMMTAVGTPSTAWDAAFLSGSGTINATNACVCLGEIGSITINGASGLSSAASLSSGAVPSWDAQIESTAFEPFTPTFSQLGSVANINCRIAYSQGGTVCKFQYSFTTGVVSSGEARASLPVTSNSNLPSLSACGYGAGSVIVSGTGAGALTPLIENNKAYITFGASVTAIQGPLIKLNGTNFINSENQTVCGEVIL